MKKSCLFGLHRGVTLSSIRIRILYIIYIRSRDCNKLQATCKDEQKPTSITQYNGMEKVLNCSCDIIRKLGGRNEEGCSDSDAQSIKATQLQAEKLVQQFDVDSDGVIDVKEFEVRVRGEKHVRSNEVKRCIYIYINKYIFIESFGNAFAVAL